MKCDRWLKIAVDEANKSEYHQKMSAVVFNKNQFISKAHNVAERSIKKHHPKFRKFPHSLHAEILSIINAKQDLKGKSILVVRVNNNNEFRLAKPCKHCESYLRYVGIKTVYYTISKFPYIIEMKL